MYCERARPCRSDDKTNRLVRAGDFSLNASQIIDVLFFTYVVRADVSSSDALASWQRSRSEGKVG